MIADFIKTFLAVFLLLFAFQQTRAQDDDVIKVDSSIVVINAAVFDSQGLPVSDLIRKQFSVYEDGIQQEILDFLPESTPFAAVILVDTSGSMESRVSLARGAAIKFIEGMRNDDVVAVYNFDSEVALVSDFGSFRGLNDKAYELKSKGMTKLNDAVYEAAAALSNRPEKRKAIIVLSDGEDTMSSRSMDKALKAALDVGANIYTVDMADTTTPSKNRGQNQAALKKFAERTGGTFVASPGGQSMRDAFVRIVSELGQQYTLTYSPTNTKTDGKWRNIEVRVAKPNLTIRTRKGYNAAKSK
ncbi:MAG TPA: VWA domain-containing protein [Pyrinomonadaceae bacterium]|nr:VWA domain-containing protein [Pyrinomonadaceae bacterium]